MSACCSWCEAKDLHGFGGLLSRTLPACLPQVSRGEIVAREKRPDDDRDSAHEAITDGYILVSRVDIPAPPSEQNYQAWEETVMRWRPAAMAARVRGDNLPPAPGDLSVRCDPLFCFCAALRSGGLGRWRRRGQRGDGEGSGAGPNSCRRTS